MKLHSTLDSSVGIAVRVAKKPMSGNEGTAKKSKTCKKTKTSLKAVGFEPTPRYYDVETIPARSWSCLVAKSLSSGPRRDAAPAKILKTVRFELTPRRTSDLSVESLKLAD